MKELTIKQIRIKIGRTDESLINELLMIRKRSNTPLPFPKGVGFIVGKRI